MRALLTLTLALSVAACSSAAPSPRAAGPAVASLPLPAPRPAEAKAGPEAPVPVPRPEWSPIPPFDLDQLSGATESAVVSTIGTPDEVRGQPPGKVWVYDHGICRIEVYLYPSVDVGSMAVLGTAMVPDTLADGERDHCRRALARRTARSR